MPRPNAYAITMTKPVQKRVLDLLKQIEICACKDHSGPNLFGCVVAIRTLVTSKSAHRGIKG